MHEPVIKAVSRNALPLALLYFAALFLALVAIISGISALIYFQASSYIPAGAMQAVVNGMLVPVIASLALLVAISVVVSWFLGSLIARRSQAMAQLRVYTQLLNISPDSIYLHDIKGKCLYANEAALKLGDITYGTSEDAWRIKDAVMLTALDGVRIKQVLEKGDLTFEAAQVRKDGSTGLVEVHSRVVQPAMDKLVISSARDITERKKIEEELRHSSEKIEKAMEGTIQSMALTSETRDPYTAGHQNRVARLACAIAAEMGLPAQQIEGIRVSGTLHDIGKIFVPAEILSKPGKLRPNELNLLKDHAEVGYELLRNIEFPWPVAEIVYQHHERLDGSGYPRGLKGDDIRLEARIMCVADVVEAMASHRPYRAAFTIEKALLEILQKKGLIYDSRVVDACMCLFNEKNYRLE
jgi:PAS domain S-box-containing protein/putative nucleotidyltransferase with HDIG domain